MDQHGDSQFAGLLPNRVETGIVHGDPIPIGVSCAQPQVLEDLQTGGSGGDIRFELGRSPLTPSALAHTLKVDVGEEDEPPRVVAGHVLEPCDEARPASARQVHHDRHVEFVHLPDKPVDALGRHAGTALVAVNVHEGKAGARYDVSGNDQRATRLVLLHGDALAGNRLRQSRGERPHQE